MDLVEGWPADLTDGKIHDRPPFDKPPHAREVPFAMIDGLIALANVDYRAVGLEDFGRPDNFLERQVDRWEGQIRSYKQLYDFAWRELPGYALARDWLRSEEHTSELQSLMRISYAVFCLKKKNNKNTH